MIHIITDSAADLPVGYDAAHQVEVVPLYLSIDGQTYHKDKIEISRDEFYHEMVVNHAFPKSSLPSVDDFYQVFEAAVKAGDEVICITITSTLSGTFGSANTAKLMILEEYPDAKIEVYDSGQNTASQLALVAEMVRMRDDGLSYEEMVNKMPTLMDSAGIIFTVGTLEYLKKGGRIGKLATTAAGKLNLRPLLLLEHGKLGIGGITRTRKRSIDDVLKHVEKFFADKNVSEYELSVGHGYDEEEANVFLGQIESLLNVKIREEMICDIGAVTAVHTGPESLGLGYCRRYEFV